MKKNDKKIVSLTKKEMIKIKGGEGETSTTILKVKHDTAKAAINNVR